MDRGRAALRVDSKAEFKPGTIPDGLHATRTEGERRRLSNPSATAIPHERIAATQARFSGLPPAPKSAAWTQIGHNCRKRPPPQETKTPDLQ
jgi:hypothetical protein